jgi:hypothetical protein
VTALVVDALAVLGAVCVVVFLFIAAAMAFTEFRRRGPRGPSNIDLRP